MTGKPELKGATDRTRVGALVVKSLVALAVTVVALWWAFEDVDFAEIGPRLAETSPRALAIYVAAQLVVHAVRTVRWALLVMPLGTPSRKAVFSAASVGIPAAMFLPLRLGEFVRPVMIARAGVPFAGGLASVVVERVADGLTNVGLFFALLAIMPESAPIPDQIRLLSKVAFAVFGGAVVVLGAIGYLQEPALQFTRRLLTPISEALATRVDELLRTFLVGLRPLMNAKRLVSFVLLTATYWAINGAATWQLASSYGIELPFIAGPFAISVLVFAVMVPAGPAFAGTMEVGFKAGLAPFQVGPENSALVAIAAHVTLIVVLSVIMGVGFLTAEPTQRPTDTEPPPPV